MRTILNLAGLAVVLMVLRALVSFMEEE